MALGFQILSAASGKPAEEIYKDVDFHRSDSTNHNKRIGEDVAELFKMKLSPYFSLNAAVVHPHMFFIVESEA